METGIDGATTGVKRQHGISADDDTDLHEMPDAGYPPLGMKVVARQTNSIHRRAQFGGDIWANGC
jgi:hypothetical protein